MVMEQLFSADVTLNPHMRFQPAAGHKAKMNSKRVLVFAIVLVCIVCAYYFSNRRHNDVTENDSLPLSDTPPQRLTIKFHAKDSDLEDKLQPENAEEDEMPDFDYPTGFTSFPKETEKNLADEESGLEADIEIDEEAERDGWNPRQGDYLQKSHPFFANSQRAAENPGEEEVVRGVDNRIKTQKVAKNQTLEHGENGVAAYALINGQESNPSQNGSEYSSDLHYKLLRQRKLLQQQAMMLNQLQEQIQRHQPNADQKPQDRLYNDQQENLQHQQRLQQGQQQNLYQGHQQSFQRGHQYPQQNQLKQEMVPLDSATDIGGAGKFQQLQIKYNASGNFHAATEDKQSYKVSGDSSPRRDKAENLHGEIKGHFNAMIMRNDNYEDSNGKPAINGFQPRRKLDSAAKPHQILEQQPEALDAARMFAKVRQKLKLSERWLPNQLKTPSMLSAEFTQGPWPRVPNDEDAIKVFAKTRQKNLQKRNEFSNPNLRQGAEKPVPPQNASNGKYVLASARGKVGVHGEKLQKEVEDKIQIRGNDELVSEAHFQQAKHDNEDSKPGVQPKLRFDNYNNNSDDKDDKEALNSTAASPNPEENLKVAIYDLAQPVEGKFHCVPLKLRVLSGTICVHPQAADAGASTQLIHRGSWEEDELKEFQEALSSSSSLGAMDLGAGLGEYTIAAASKNHKVVAVEPWKANYRLFQMTMQLNALTDLVTLVTDALGEASRSGKKTTTSLSIGQQHGSSLRGAHKAAGEIGSVTKDLVVRIVRLDDLLPIVPFSSVVIKLDLQGDEHRVLRGARKFFTQIDVQYVLMHWLASQNKLNFKEAENFLRQHGYEPALKVKGEQLYTEEDLSKDIHFIVWRKKHLSYRL